MAHTTIQAPSARKINLVFHGPFVFKSTASGVTVLTPVIAKHKAVYGTDPITDPASVKRRRPIPKGDIKISGIAGGKMRYVIPEETFPLWHPGPYSPSATHAVFQLPVPVAGALGRTRKFKRFESYTVTTPKDRRVVGPAQSASKVHVLQYNGDSKCDVALATLHFHVEFLTLPAQADSEHDLRAIENLYGGKVRINHNFPLGKIVVIGHVAGAAAKLVASKADLNSLYEAGSKGGITDTHCENYGERP